MLIKNASDFGVLIRDARNTAGLTQTALAKRIGVSRQWLSEIERGKTSAEIGLVMKALKALGVALHVDDDADDTIPAAPDIDAIVDNAQRTP